MPSDDFGDEGSHRLEARVYDRPVLETHWQVPIDLPELPTILLQQTDGGRWNNHFTRVVEDGVARPAAGNAHSADAQLRRTISDIVTADAEEESDDIESTATDDEAEDESTDRAETVSRTEQEGLNAFA